MRGGDPPQTSRRGSFTNETPRHRVATVTPLVIIVLVIALVYGLHRLALFAEYRGWIYYRTRPPRMRTLGLLEELADPSVEYRVEEQASEAIRADDEDSGDLADR